MRESRLVGRAEEQPQRASVTVVLPRIGSASTFLVPRLPQTRTDLSAYPPKGCSSLTWVVSNQDAELKSACSPWVTPLLCLQEGCEEGELGEDSNPEVQKFFVGRRATDPRPRPSTQVLDPGPRPT